MGSPVGFSDIPEGFMVGGQQQAGYSDMPSGFAVGGQQPAQPDDSLVGGMGRGFAKRLVGTLQTARDLGETLYGPAPNDANEKATYQKLAAGLEQQGKGAGLTGTIGEMIGDPVNLLPMGKGLLKAGAVMGGLSGLTAPQENDTGLGNRVAGAAIGAGTGAVAAPIIGRVAEGVGAGAQYLANKSGLTDLATGIAQKLGANPTGGDLYEAAKAAGLDITGKTPQEIHADLNNWLSQNIGGIASDISTKDFNPASAHAAIAKTIGEGMDKANTLYQTARDAGEGQAIEVPGLVGKLNGMIEALDGNVLPGSSEANALAKLRAIRKSLPESTSDVVYGGMTEPKIPVNDLLNLRSALNEGFNPEKYASRGDVPIGEIGNDVREALAVAGNRNKAFGNALTEADTHQADLSQTLKNNPVLDRIFQPEDYHAYKALDERGIPLPDATRERASQLLDNLKTPEEMDAAIRGLPVDMADSLRAAKFRQLMDDSGITNLNLEKNYPALKAALKNNPEALKLLDNMNTVTEELNRRGVPGNPDFSEKGSRLHEALGAVWDTVTGHPAYALKHALGVIKPPPVGAQTELTRLAGDLANQAPGATAVQSATQAAGNAVADRTATLLGRGYGSDQGAVKPATAPPVQTPEVVPTVIPDTPKASIPLLQRIAQAESGGNSSAQNPNSSASGPLQFTNDTWTQMVAKYGKQTGITLQDKNNPQAQMVMGEMLKQENTKYLASKLGRPPTDGEIYAAHFLGAPDAAKLINAVQATPDKQAILLYPRKVVSDNRNIFFDANRPRTVAEVYSLLNDKVS